jgi:hypothetical protein
MEAALRSKGKDPVSEFCRWNDHIKEYARQAGIHSIFDKGTKYVLTEVSPLVYHLYGDIDTPRSMVLTDKDYKSCD